jgi:uncharacterized membrane protein YedE/YeeE
VKRALPLVAGALFGAGVCVSGMVRPSKVIGFLDWRSGRWDATLLVVMASALLVSVLAWRIVARMRAPWLGGAFPGPPSPALDPNLVGGAALFGLGWGLSGYCPGPAVVSIVSHVPGTLVFVAAMIAGMWIGERARTDDDG